MLKLDLDGNVLWAQSLPGSDQDSKLQGLAVDPRDGAAVVTGYFNGLATFQPGSPGQIQLASTAVLWDDIAQIDAKNDILVYRLGVEPGLQ